MIATVRFEWSGVEIDIHPATKDNPFYRAALEVASQPYRLALDAGKLSEERAEQIMAKAYSIGVIEGSRAAHLIHFKEADWEKWLLENPDEFATIRDVAENPDRWEPGIWQ